MNYFTLRECIRSDTARIRGIDNNPDAAVRYHIVETVERLLDPLRAAWSDRCAECGLGTPAIRVSSGYRSPQLNVAIGGSSTSAHCSGYAFDLIPLNGRMAEFRRFCCEFLADKPFDQLISEDERADGLPRWMHIGYRNRRGEQRRQKLSMRGGHYFPMRM